MIDMFIWRSTVHYNEALVNTDIQAESVPPYQTDHHALADLEIYYLHIY